MNQASHHSPGHVHFKSLEDSFDHESEITLTFLQDNFVDIALGFLQHNYIYEINIEVKDSLGEDLKFDPLQSLNIRLKEYEPSSDGSGHCYNFEFKAIKEHLMVESFKVTSLENPDRYLTLKLHAQVLGKGKGTPSLRNGIHCIGYCPDDDTDVGSDWPGFEGAS